MNRARLIELGRHLSSRERARDLRREVLAHITESSRLTVDFEGVLSVSDSFADEFFAILAARYGADWFREHVAIENASEEIRAAIVRVIRFRLEGTRALGPAVELEDPPEELDYVS